MVKLIEYLTIDGKSIFAEWFEALEPKAAAKVTIALDRMKRGLMGDVKPVGSGVTERRIDYGPGYRIYFAQDGDKLIILLGGGTKKRQQQDIEDSISSWQDYKTRKQKD